jgi:hypothetical protein
MKKEEAPLEYSQLRKKIKVRVSGRKIVFIWLVFSTQGKSKTE